MNKYLLLWICFSIGISFTWTQIEVEQYKFPYQEVVEWTGQGTLLYGADPSGKTNNLNISLFNHSGKIDWNLMVYPKNDETHLIVSGMSKYIYFVDNLKPYKSNVRYNQISISGKVIPTSFSVLKEMKKFGYSTPDDLILKDIINTQKALVFYYQLPVKAEDKMEHIFITITHHNNRVYSYQGPSTNYKSTIKGEIDDYIFAGADEETIHFAQHGVGETTFLSFSPKGEEMNQHREKIIGIVQPISSTVYFGGLNGGYYLEKENISSLQSRGVVVDINDRFYYIVNDEKDRCLKIVTKDKQGNLVAMNECTTQAKEKRNYKRAVLYILPLKEGLIAVSEIEQTKFAYIIQNNEVKELDVESLNPENIQKNPSSFLQGENSVNFVHEIEGQFYYFDTSTIKSSKTIIFKQ